MILGAVLAGGRSSRFGTDKARAIWRGVALADHVRARLATVAAATVVCGGAGGGPDILPDAPGPDRGPLAGLASALRFAQANGFDRVILAPCDTPVLDDALLAALATARGDAFLAAVPVIGTWRARHAARLADHLAHAEDRSMRRWAALAGAAALDLPAPPNINRPADLAALG